MSDLSPEARALLRDGHGVLRPSAQDRSRVAGALAARLGPAAMLVSTPAVAATTKSVLWQKVSLAAVGVGMAVAGATYWSQQSVVEVAPTRASQPRVAEAVVSPAPAPAKADEPAPQPENQAALPPPAPPPAVKATPSDRLAEEVSILSRAMTVLRAGNPSEALRLLETHRQQFPSGRLAEERRAARVQALCALGRRPEAETELSKLERSAPRSPHVARAKRACGLN